MTTTGGGVEGDAANGSAAAVAAALRDAGAVTVVCHVRPDPDTIGSGLALGQALRALGVDVEVSYAGPETMPVALSFLPGAQLLVPTERVRGYRTVVSVDTASIERLDALRGVFEAADRSVVIDHHASNQGFGDVSYVDPDADCAAALVLDVVDALGVTLDADMATCLYAGLATDTGSFKWARPVSFRVAARLLEAGVDGPRWSRILFDTHPFGWLSMVGNVIAAARLVPEACDGAGLVYTAVTAADLDGLDWEESERVVDIVRTVAEAEVAAVFKEVAPGEWSVSLRSKEAVDLVPIAGAHGGGGHRRAAGYNDRGTVDEIAARLMATI